MAFYIGNFLQSDEVKIGSPVFAKIYQAEIASDVVDQIDAWFNAGLSREDVHYFTIYEQDRAVGQILLHDIDSKAGSSLIAYHLFSSSLRRRGVGTKALQLLVRYVREQTKLHHLVVITSQDNLASQRLAQKCGFEFTGAAREGAHLMVFELELNLDSVK